MTETLQITLLGGAVLRLGDRPLTGLASRRTEALLIYLACTGHSHTRDALAGFLWDDRPQARALGNLRVLLTSLRQNVGAHVTITRQTVAFDRTSPYLLDTEILEEQIRDSRQQRDTRGLLSALGAEQLSRALDLYRGDFMQGFYLRDSSDFEEWQSIERERMRLLVMDALDDLIASYRAFKNYPAGIDQARRLIQMDPLNEPAHCHLMQLLALSGQRSAALAQYETCRKVLAEDLGIEPMAETTAVSEAIRAGRLGAQEMGRWEYDETGRQADRERGREGERQGWRDQPSRVASDRATFVARERELEQLEAFLQQGIAGRGQMVLVSGEAGSGKSALVQEFAQRAQESYPQLVVAAGNSDAQTGLGDPYLPFRELLAMLSGDVQTPWVDGGNGGALVRHRQTLIPITAEVIVELGPNLLGRLIDSSSLLMRATAFAPQNTPWLQRLEQRVVQHAVTTSLGDLQQSNLFEQYTRVLQALAAHRPLLLILDDLHWADTASISLLFHLGRHIGNNRILILGTYRPEDVAQAQNGSHHPLVGVLSELKRFQGHLTLSLDLVDWASQARFVNELLDSEPNRLGDEFRRALTRQTQGTPLFVTELLHELKVRGNLVQDGRGRWVEGPSLTWDVMPARVEGVLETRMERLDPQLQHALRVASVEGEVFTAEVVAQVTGTDALTLIHELSDELDRHHRLVRAEGLQWTGPQRLSRYRFRHCLFRKYLYDSLDEIQRSHLHEAVGTALEALYRKSADQIAVQLARHFEQAGIHDKAADYRLKAEERQSFL